MFTLELFGKFPKKINRQFILDLLNLTQALVGVKSSLSLVVRTVNDKEMKALNLRYRNKDKTTDVLSFAYDEGENFVGPPGESQKRGEIIISPGQVRRQAKEIGRAMDQEFALMVIHGFLHILGFDHASRKQERQMFALQQEVMFRAKVI